MNHAGDRVNEYMVVVVVVTVKKIKSSSSMVRSQRMYKRAESSKWLYMYVI
jgi:hypothetical protein